MGDYSVERNELRQAAKIHPQGADPVHAEVWRVMWRELYLLGGEPGETPIDTLCRVAVSLGARAPGALRESLHGPVRKLG